jgi:hypothetical protein
MLAGRAVIGGGSSRARGWADEAIRARGWLGTADCARGRPAGEEPTTRGVVWEESARGRPAGEVTTVGWGGDGRPAGEVTARDGWLFWRRLPGK